MGIGDQVQRRAGHALDLVAPLIERGIELVVVERSQVVVPPRVEANLEPGLDERADGRGAKARVRRVRSSDLEQPRALGFALLDGRRLDRGRDLVD